MRFVFLDVYSFDDLSVALIEPCDVELIEISELASHNIVNKPSLDLLKLVKYLLLLAGPKLQLFGEFLEMKLVAVVEMLLGAGRAVLSGAAQTVLAVQTPLEQADVDRLVFGTALQIRLLNLEPV